MKSFFLRIYNSKSYHDYKYAWFLLGICFLFVLLRIPSLNEPYWYGDEGIYQVVGRAIGSGKVLYRDIWDNKPPLLYIIYAVVNGDLYIVKLLSLFVGLFSSVAFFFLSRSLFNKSSSSYIATIVFVVLFGSPLLEGNIANAENFMMLPIIIASCVLISYSKNKNYQALILAGLLLSIALITKIVVIFDFVAFLLFVIFSERILKMGTIVKNTLNFFIPFISMMLICFLYFLSQNAFKDFYSAVFIQNVSYVGEQNRFIFPMGVLIIKSVLLLVALITLFITKKKLTKVTLFIYVWIILSIYSALFSERPYIHYLLVILPSFALLVGHFAENTKLRIIDGIAIIAIALFAYFHFHLYLKSIDYYLNYVKFIANKEKVMDYEAFFDKNTPRDYDIAHFIGMNVKHNESVFLWSDSAQIYALSNKLPISKYIVAYHITFYKNADIITKQQIDKVRPKYIIQTIEQPLLDGILSSYQLRYIMEGVKIYEREI